LQDQPWACGANETCHCGSTESRQQLSLIIFSSDTKRFPERRLNLIGSIHSSLRNTSSRTYASGRGPGNSRSRSQADVSDMIIDIIRIIKIEVMSGMTQSKRAVYAWRLCWSPGPMPAGKTPLPTSHEARARAGKNGYSPR
jgi:hypothetical protein